MNPTLKTSLHCAVDNTLRRVPEWIRMVAAEPASNRDFTASSVRSDMRVVKKYKLTWRVSHDADELATHLDRDYYPHTRLRHGDDSFVQPPRWMRNTFRKGGLLWVEREGEPIAGLVFEHVPPSFACRGSPALGPTKACCVKGP